MNQEDSGLFRREVLVGGAASALAIGVAGCAPPNPVRGNMLWGVAASSAQTESRQGRGRSNWDVFADTPGAIKDGSNNSRCTEFERRYEEDLDLLQAGGVRAFRFSTAWPRIQPEGPGAPSQVGLDLYSRMVDSMLARKIEPWVTLMGALTIQHGPILAVSWPAMTMTFKATPPSLLKGLRVGQTVGFDTTVRGMVADVTAVHLR